MKTYSEFRSFLAKATAAFGAAIFATSALQAQVTGYNTLIKVSNQTQDFVQEAARANQNEIAMAKIAEGKAQKTKVKDLAQTLRSDHQKNNEELKAIARAHGVALDTFPAGTCQADMDRLQKAQDADFDKEYTKVMLKDNVKCIKRFDKAASEIEEQDVKKYAQNTLPALRIHLLKSEEAARSAGVDESTIASFLKDLPSDDQLVSSR